MKLPFKIMLEDPKSKHALETVTNPYSGQSCQLPRYAVAVYDVIKGAELTGDVTLMRKGLDWFQKNFTDQYYVLLDQKNFRAPMAQKVRTWRPGYLRAGMGRALRVDPEALGLKLSSYKLDRLQAIG